MKTSSFVVDHSVVAASKPLPTKPIRVNTSVKTFSIRKVIKTLFARTGGWWLPLLMLAGWQLVASFQLLPEAYLKNISSPNAVLQAGYELIKSGELWQHLGISALRAFAGLLIGGLFGLRFGLLTSTLPVFRTLLDTTFQMLRNIPHLALIPLVIVWFGIDEAAKVFLVAVGTFFPIYLNTYHGVRNVDKHLVEMAKSYDLTGWALFKEVILPGALPSILVGVRFSLGIMWLTLIVAETISATTGIGYLAMHAREFFQIDIIMFSILVYALLEPVHNLFNNKAMKARLVN